MRVEVGIEPVRQIDMPRASSDVRLRVAEQSPQPRLDGDAAQTLQRLTLNDDGRADGALLDAAAMAVGRYRLLFEVAPYFRSRGLQLPEPPFIDVVQLDFGIADASGHYHVPLLVSPWAYSTYRGS